MPSKKCIHNRRKSECKDCGGSQICDHQKRKDRCKECGGNQICEHNKQKSQCKECGGSQICEHNNFKSICKDCGGSQICDHNIRKSICKDCGGSQICEHKIIKYECKECGGSRICEHNRLKYQCKECGGSKICEHNIRKDICKDCGGSQICEHNRQKYRCKECGGSQICKHNRIKSTCKDCGGSALCKSEWCETYKNKKYNGYCFICFIHMFPDSELIRNYKTKEKSVVDFIKSTFFNVDWIHDKIIKDGCSRRRPDLYLDLGYQVLVIEIDENQHEDYDESCENRRLMEISKDINHRPLIFIRFNPDEYIKLNGEKIKSSWKYTKKGLCVIRDKKEWEMRLNGLKNKVEEWINPNKILNKTVEVIELFYDEKIAFYLEL